MNTTQSFFIAALSILLNGPVLAQEATPDTWISATSSASRAQIARELAQAERDGTIHAVSIGYDFVKHSHTGTLTRAEVRAQLDAARASGELASIDSLVPAMSARRVQHGDVQVAQRARALR